MAHFITSGEIFRDGTDLAAFGSVDVTVTAPGTTLEQTAPAELSDGMNVRKFLYWDTGRRITNKRKVRWTFNHPGNWSEWRAAAWYGTPGFGPGGEPLVRLDAHWVGVGTIDPTPIDGAGSTFVNAPGGTPLAFPFGGDDHLVSTQWGPASIRAKDHLQRAVGDPQLDFSSWTQLVYGGDDSGFFSESDDDVTPGGGILGIPASTSQVVPVLQNSASVLLAGYVAPGRRMVDPGEFFARFERYFRENSIEDILKFPPKGDPSPEDIIRLKLIAESLDLVRGDTNAGADPFEGLASAGKKMNPAQLKRTIAATRAALRRGEAAVKSLETLLERGK